MASDAVAVRVAGVDALFDRAVAAGWQAVFAAGLMTAAGEETVRAAKTNGRWTALDAVEDLTETRAARVEQTVAEAAQGRRANQWRQPREHR